MSERERDRESEIVSECVSECVCARTRALASVRHTKAYGCMRKTEHACMLTNVHVISWVLGGKM